MTPWCCTSRHVSLVLPLFLGGEGREGAFFFLTIIAALIRLLREDAATTSSHSVRYVVALRLMRCRHDSCLSWLGSAGAAAAVVLTTPAVFQCIASLFQMANPNHCAVIIII